MVLDQRVDEILKNLPDSYTQSLEEFYEVVIFLKITKYKFKSLFYFFNK